MGAKDPREAPVLTAWQSRLGNRHPLPDEGNRLLPGPDQAPDPGSGR